MTCATDENPLDAALEKLVDAHGLRAVAASLADICDAKAEQIATNWQDKASAKNWAMAGRAAQRFWKALRLP